MAATAQRDLQNRSVTISRIRLLETLRTNLVTHMADYEEAITGYKSQLLKKIQKSFSDARNKLETSEAKALRLVDELKDEDIEKQKDYLVVCDTITVDMLVPKLYSKEYEQAISMFEWDVRENIELTYAEFTCFVRDEWSWKRSFDEVSTFYKSFA